MIISGWLLLVIGLGALIFDRSRFHALERKPVATLIGRSGAVQVREAGSTRWMEGFDGQGLFDGDQLATSSGAAAEVAFKPGQMLRLAEDTQVAFLTISTAYRDSAYVVTILRGKLAVGVDRECKGCPPVVVRAGDDIYKVAPGAKVGVKKPVGGKAARFNPTQFWLSGAAEPGQ